MNTDDERLSGALQENLLTVLVFDEAHCKIARAALTPQLFESSVYREVAGIAMDFIDQYGEPVKEHVADHLESVLKGDDRRKAKAYESLLNNLHASRETVNAKYVMTQLHRFVRLQTFKSGIVQIVELVQDGKLSEAEVVMQSTLSKQVVAFEGGLDLSDADAVGRLLDEPEEEGFTLGIEELDRRGVIPRRKELMLLVAARGKGKSWFLTHCAKRALVQKWSVLVVTLEMSEKRYAVRMLQSFFSISRRQAETRVSRLVLGRDGELEGLLQERIKRMSLQDEGIKEKLVAKAGREFKRRKRLRIKEFPSGALTLADLEAYLDGLERFENFVPDLICIDYPDLMKVSSDNLRLDLGALVVGLRGIAVKRNSAVVAVSQGNRDSEGASTVTGKMVAEDISKLATADNLLTYSQTDAEYALGLGRLSVEKARNEESKGQVLLTQAYALGQFALDSARLGAPDDYWGIVAGDKKGAPAPERTTRRRRREDD